MLILPAIDLIGGQCVRLTHGDYNKKTVYNANPLDVAQSFVDQGASWLHLVDLDAARGNGVNNSDIVRQICGNVRIRVELGGGIRSVEAISQMLDVGVSRLVLGTAAISDPKFAEIAFAKWGDQIVLGIDTKDGLVATQAWTHVSATTGTDLAINMVARGCQRIIYTDIATDGAFTGPNLPALEEMILAAGVPVIASGGVSSLSDIVALSKIKALEGVIVGKAIYEGKVNLSEAIATVGPKSKES